MRAKQCTEGMHVRIAPAHRRAFNVFGRLSPDRVFVYVGTRDGQALISLGEKRMSRWLVPFAWIEPAEPARIGRPPATGEARSIQLKARVSESEAREYERLRKLHGCESISDVIRLAMSRLGEER